MAYRTHSMHSPRWQPQWWNRQRIVASQQLEHHNGWEGWRHLQQGETPHHCVGHVGRVCLCGDCLCISLPTLTNVTHWYSSAHKVCGMASSAIQGPTRRTIILYFKWSLKTSTHVPNPHTTFMYATLTWHLFPLYLPITQLIHPLNSTPTLNGPLILTHCPPTTITKLIVSLFPVTQLKTRILNSYCHPTQYTH